MGKIALYAKAKEMVFMPQEPINLILSLSIRLLLGLPVPDSINSDFDSTIRAGTGTAVNDIKLPG